MRWRRFIRPAFDKPAGPRAGLYHYRRETADRLQRWHLRVEHDGSGVLIVNASGVLFLNPSAVLLMHRILEGADGEAAIRAVRKVYRADRRTVAADYDRIQSVIAELDTAEDACPIRRLDVEDAPAFGEDVSAPYRADLALDYACNNRCLHCYVPRKPGDKPPLGLDEWRAVLDRLWSAGVPHVCFTGGEATLSPHLAALIERAEDLGQVSGLLTNGRRLSDPAFTHGLCEAGLDHVQITVESSCADVHDRMVGGEGSFTETVEGIRNAIAEDIYLVTNTTLCDLNADDVEETIQFLCELGVKQFAMNSFIQTGAAPQSGHGLDDIALEEILSRVVEQAEDCDMRFIWYTPTHYCQFNPASYGLGLKRCTAAEYNICVEPDGDVIPCQSYYEPAGNILRDDWDAIWHSDLFKAIRTRARVADTCRTCPDLATCGGGCPLSEGDRFLCTDSVSEG